MNTWDYDRATCHAPEEDASDAEGGGGSAISSQLIVGNSKGANALSYRRLLFSQDGRLRPIYSEKNKYGHGIFSYSEVHTALDSDEYIAPTRSVGYWWSSLYDDFIGGEYSTGSKRHPSVSNRSSKKDKDLNKDSDCAVNMTNGSQFDLIDGVTVVSKREFWPQLCGDYRDFDMESVESSIKAYHTVEAYQKMHKLTNQPTRHSANSLRSKNISRRCMLSIQEIIKVEMNIVRNCIFLAIREYDCSAELGSFLESASSGFGSAPLSSIWGILKSARFFTEREEACRDVMTMTCLRDSIRRLEELDELRITYCSDGDLCVHPLQNLSSLIQLKKDKKLIHHSEPGTTGTPTGIIGKKTSSTATSHTSVDPLLGTSFYWAPCGEKEIVKSSFSDLIRSDLNRSTTATLTNERAGQNEDNDTMLTSADSIEDTSTFHDHDTKHCITYGSVKPPLKLRKLLKSHYCTTKVEK